MGDAQTFSNAQNKSLRFPERLRAALSAPVLLRNSSGFLFIEHRGFFEERFLSTSATEMYQK